MIYLILSMLLTGDRFQINAALLDFLFIKELFPSIDGYWVPNKHIILISEGSCDTEDWTFFFQS